MMAKEILVKVDGTPDYHCKIIMHRGSRHQHRERSTMVIVVHHHHHLLSP